ncbi:Uncharacterised protein [Mycobacterium tuberculosis]|nr:Uncharacterised protein [Mycobacterium tuberculosis]
MSSTPSTRRQPAIAFCAWLNTSVAVCIGLTNSVTRNRNAISFPADTSPAMPRSVPAMTTAAVASAATSSLTGNVSATIAWARVCASRWASTVSSTRRPVRSSEAYARMTGAPTTDSPTAASRSPIRSRTSM